MRFIGCDLHARQQTLAMLETTTGETTNLTLLHEGNQVSAETLQENCQPSNAG